MGVILLPQPLNVPGFQIWATTPDRSIFLKLDSKVLHTLSLSSLPWGGGAKVRMDAWDITHVCMLLITERVGLSCMRHSHWHVHMLQVRATISECVHMTLQVVGYLTVITWLSPGLPHSLHILFLARLLCTGSFPAFYCKQGTEAQVETMIDMCPGWQRGALNSKSFVLPSLCLCCLPRPILFIMVGM